MKELKKDLINFFKKILNEDTDLQIEFEYLQHKCGCCNNNDAIIETIKFHNIYDDLLANKILEYFRDDYYTYIYINTDEDENKYIFIEVTTEKHC